MPAYSTDWIKRLNKLRETDPEAAREIEKRADQLYEGYTEEEVYSRGGVAKTPGARYQDAGRDSRARAMEQALSEYERMAGATQPEPESWMADLPEEDPLAGLPETGASDTGIVPFKSAEELAQMSEAERVQYRKDRLRSVGAGDRLQDTPTGLTDEELAESISPERPTEPYVIAEDTTEDQPDDVELLPFAMEDIKDLEDPTLLQRLGRFAGSDKGLAVLQALAKGGQAYMGGRAQSEANQQMRQSQARANLINALSSRAGARGTAEKPRMGKLGTLFGTLADIGGGLREERTAERKREQERDEFEALRDYRQESLDVQRAGQEARLVTEEKRIERQEARDQLSAMKSGANAMSKTIASGIASGQYKSLEDFFAADESARAEYEQLPDFLKLVVRSGFSKGLADREKRLGAAKGGDFQELKAASEILKDAWSVIENPSSFAKGAFAQWFDDDSLLLSRFMPGAAFYRAEAGGLGISLASAFNKGRPSDADARAVARLLPKVGEPEEVVRAKFAALDRLILLKQLAETNQWTGREDQSNILTTNKILTFDKSGMPNIDIPTAQSIFGQEGVVEGEEQSELTYEDI
jgi:hypothetical protein